MLRGLLRDLQGEYLIPDALNPLQGYTRPVSDTSLNHGCLFRQVYHFAAVAGCIGIGDIVAGRVERALIHVQGQCRDPHR